MKRCCINSASGAVVREKVRGMTKLNNLINVILCAFQVVTHAL